jgi:hypothetical protein
MLKILGAGMPRTGTRTLCEALTILGYEAVHNPRNLSLFPADGETWRLPWTPGAMADGSAVLYWAELATSYQCKVILTVRNVESWWESIKRHTNAIRTGEQMEHIAYTDAFHGLLFGTPQPCKYWWQRRFEEHNLRVKAMIAADSLLVMDIVAGDKWDVLCPFLEKPEPGEEWPWRNKAIL